MRVVLARQRIGPSFGGAEGYVAMLAEALRALGSSVTLLAQSVDAQTRDEGFEVVSAPSRPTNVWSAHSFARTVGRYVLEHVDRQVISFDRIPGSRFIRAGDGSHRAYLASMGQTSRSIFSIKHQSMLCLERRAFTHPDIRLIFANSRMVAEDIRAAYGVPEEKIRVVYTGLPSRPAITPTVRDAIRSSLNFPAGSRVILFAGNNYERKGLGTLLSALGILQKSSSGGQTSGGWKLLVAGRGDVGRYETVAQLSGIGRSVIFFGQRPLEDLFAVSNLFVLPTRYDPLARVCLEAAQAGIPVITTRKNGFAEWIPPEDRFVMENPEDTKSLAEILERAFTMDLSAAGRRLRERTAHLTIESNAEEILTHLGRLA